MKKILVPLLVAGLAGVAGGGAYASSPAGAKRVVAPDPAIASSFSALSTPTVSRDSLAADLAGVADLAQIHPAGPARLGLTPYLVPSLSGGLCLFFKQADGSSLGHCAGKGDASSQQFDGRIGSTNGDLWVGLRADGIDLVAAADGSTVPLIGNVYIIDHPEK